MENLGFQASLNAYSISELLIYPVKSLGGISLESCQVTERGFEHDRRWMLVDVNNRFITQREFPELVFFRTAIIENNIVVTDKRDHCSIKVPIIPNLGELISVDIWNDRCEALCMDQFISDWFAERLSQPIKMVYMPEQSQRSVDPDYALNGELTSFSDGYPVLIIGEASLQHLNSRLDEPIGMDRFRPNIVFKGSYPFEEDSFKDIAVGDAMFRAVKPCARCILTTTNQESGVRSPEPLKTMSVYRKFNNKIYFGQNLLVLKTGQINLGDSLNILSRQPTVFKS
jgi:uncharacterized protein YcbX